MSTLESSATFDPVEAVLLRRPPRSLWRDAWRRVLRNKLAILSLGYIALLATLAIAAPLFAPHNPNKQDLRVAGKVRQAAWISAEDPKRSGLWTYPLGTDQLGRDVLSRLIYGARVSLIVGFVPMIITITIGTLFGLLSGYLGGRTDNLLMRLTDVMYAFPDLLFFIIILTTLRDTGFGRFWNGFLLLFLSLSLVSWVGVARLVRGQVLSLKEKEFVEAARAIGASPWRIVWRHILPNSLGPIIVSAAFILPGAVIAEAILSYLGIGTIPDVRDTAPFPASWGTMILEGKAALEAQPWLMLSPAVAIALLTLAFTSLGDGLRDAFDPRSEP